MNLNEIIKYIEAGKLDRTLSESCSIQEQKLSYNRQRYVKAVKEFENYYGKTEDIHLFSVGGRSEIIGNHTDHNNGKVVAASINLDILAIATKTDDSIVRVKSEGFPEDIVMPEMVKDPSSDNYFNSSSLIAGMERAFLDAGYKTGGFVAYTTSNVLKGSGLSSSATFEVMIGNILNYLYNDGKVSNVEIAKMAQFSENVYFGKPCGLMDQTACAVGGFITIDFEKTGSPVIEALDFDLTKEGYSLCIVNTGGNHADLNEDYASVPKEMKEVAAVLGKKVLRGTTFEELLGKAQLIRASLGDRALMRAMHFVKENDRVDALVKAIRDKDINGFHKNITASGNSSFKFLQNVYTSKNIKEQGLSVALCITENFLEGNDGSCRVHGGGFAGTIQAFIRNDMTEDYKAVIESVFGEGSCNILSVRRDGAIMLI